MTKQELFRKLTSRKLWAALAGLSAGLAMAFGLDEAVISTVAGAVVAVASVATYIVTEGRLDAEGIKKAVESVQEAVEAVEEMERFLVILLQQLQRLLPCQVTLHVCFILSVRDNLSALAERISLFQAVSPGLPPLQTSWPGYALPHARRWRRHGTGNGSHHCRPR